MALTKRIDELDPYGSVDDSKKKKDLFELSKNSGTYGSPVYAVGDSRKITQEEIENMLNYIPYSNSNCEIVKNNGTALENGIRLVYALAACKIKTPNGLALSETNRAVVFLINGKFDLSGNALVIDTDFVDIICLCDPKETHIFSDNPIGTIQVHNNKNFIIKGFSVENTGIGKSIYLDPLDTDTGEWDSLRILSPASINGTYAGTYNKIVATANYVLAGDITGRVSNSTFLQYSCGYGYFDCTISGIIEDCICDRYCFGFAEAFAGVCTITEDAVIRRCKSTLRSYGFASQEANSIVSGTIEDCEGGGEDFGGTTSTGQLIRCKTPQLFYPHAGTLDTCTINGTFPHIVLKDGAKMIRSTSIAFGAYGAIETESGAEVTIYLCASNVGINSFSSNAYTNLVPLPRNVIFDQDYEVLPSPDGNLWKLTIDNSGIPTTELIP